MAKTLTQEEVIQRIKNSFIQDVDLISDYVNRRTSITLKCNKCNYSWQALPQTVLYGKNHNCPNCISMKTKVICDFCGKKFSRNINKLQTKSGFHYCSKECGNRHKNQIREENGEWNDSNNYRLKAFKVYEHKCAICGWNEDERILEVHHKDENHSNNNIDNLCILCPICHRKISLHYYILTNDFQLIEI